MKQVIIWSGLVLVLVGTIIFLGSYLPSGWQPFKNSKSEPVATTTPPTTFDQAIVYTCADGSVIAMAFKTGDTKVLELSLPNSNPLVLNQIESASGVKYSHESGVIFWEKGGTALVEIGGETKYSECKVRPVGTPDVSVATEATSSELTGTQWVWLGTTYATGTAVEPNKPEDFSVTFAENNRFSANTDCNNVGGSFVGGNDGAVSFKDMVSTLMACEGETKEAVFVSQLSQVVSYKMTGQQLILSIKSDEESGEMEFAKKLP